MGAIEHNVMAAVTCNEQSYERITAAILLRDDRDKFVFFDTRMNGYRVIMIPPDGSKSGYIEDELGTSRRNWLASEIQKDANSVAWDWCDMCFGWYGARIEATNCKGDEE